jgi:hypothetical protein
MNERMTSSMPSLKRRSFSWRAIRQLSAAAALLAVACGPWMPSPREPGPPPPKAAKPTKLGAGYYINKAPKGEPLPADAKDRPVKPIVTDDFDQLPITKTPTGT